MCSSSHLALRLSLNTAYAHTANYCTTKVQGNGTGWDLWFSSLSTSQQGLLQALCKPLYKVSNLMKDATVEDLRVQMHPPICSLI